MQRTTVLDLFIGDSAFGARETDEAASPSSPGLLWDSHGFRPPQPDDGVVHRFCQSRRSTLPTNSMHHVICHSEDDIDVGMPPARKEASLHPDIRGSLLHSLMAYTVRPALRHLSDAAIHAHFGCLVLSVGATDASGEWDKASSFAANLIATVRALTVALGLARPPMVLLLGTPSGVAPHGGVLRDQYQYLSQRSQYTVVDRPKSNGGAPSISDALTATLRTAHQSYPQLPNTI